MLDSGEYDDLKGRPVVTYCTGGIRCEVLSSLMASRGFGEVYQLEGGIVRYGERFGDDGLWEGSLYVFDGRGSVDFSDHAAVIGACAVCGDADEPHRQLHGCLVPHAARRVRVVRQRGVRAPRSLAGRVATELAGRVATEELSRPRPGHRCASPSAQLLDRRGLGG